MWNRARTFNTGLNLKELWARRWTVSGRSPNGASPSNLLSPVALDYRGANHPSDALTPRRGAKVPGPCGVFLRGLLRPFWAVTDHLPGRCHLYKNLDGRCLAHRCQGSLYSRARSKRLPRVDKASLKSSLRRTLFAAAEPQKSLALYSVNPGVKGGDLSKRTLVEISFPYLAQKCDLCEVTLATAAVCTAHLHPLLRSLESQGKGFAVESVNASKSHGFLNAGGKNNVNRITTSHLDKLGGSEIDMVDDIESASAQQLRSLSLRTESAVTATPAQPTYQPQTRINILQLRLHSLHINPRLHINMLQLRLHSLHINPRLHINMFKLRLHSLHINPRLQQRSTPHTSYQLQLLFSQCASTQEARLSSLPVNHPNGQWRPYHTHLLSPRRQRISLRKSSQLSQPISWRLYHRTS
ncbi:unnamed protein product [Boreogadus saida]